MTLLELCEPLFQYICRLNRSARKGGMFEIVQVRTEIKTLFDEMKAKSSADLNLSEQYEKVRLPLIFFVDLMIKDSKLPFANDWEELASEVGELAGDERFFDLLDDTLVDQSRPAAERLAVFYICMGLGFDGIYAGQTEELQKFMLKCSARISNMMDVDENTRICPESYENVDTRNLIEPPNRKLVGIGVALVGLVIVLFIANIFLYQWRSDDLTTSLDNIVAHQTVVPDSSSVPSEFDDNKSSKENK